MMDAEYEEGQSFKIPYVNVNRITQRREKLHGEMTELSRMLEVYKLIEIRDWNYN